jgi:hypothetical protein
MAILLQIRKKGAKWPLLSAEGCHTLPDHSAELFADGRRSLKAVKALSGMISWPIQEIGFKPMLPQDTERQLQGNPGIFSLRQFLVNDVLTLL